MTSSSSGRGGGLGDLGSMVLSVAGICANGGGWGCGTVFLCPVFLAETFFALLEGIFVIADLTLNDWYRPTSNAKKSELKSKNK